LIGSTLVIRRKEQQLSPSAGEATWPGELSELAGHVSVVFAAGRFWRRRGFAER